MPFDASSSVNETAIDFSARALGSELREARRGVRLSQKGLALAASIDLATVQGLERGVGTLRSLLAVFDALGLRFADQPSDVALGQWIADARKATGNSQAAVALIIGVSKPTIIQIEHGRGNIRSLLQMMSFLRLSPTVAPHAAPQQGARLILGDCLEVMATMADGSVDLIVTSPPYNLGNANGGGLKARGKSGVWGSATIANGYENHEDNMPHDEYVRWQQAALREMWRLIPDDGAIFYNHKHRIFKGSQLSARELIPPELNIRQEIIWDRGNGYNFGKSYFTPSHELIILIAKPKFKLRKYAVDRDVWRIGADRGNPHPAPFPVALASKCIDATNAKVVFDPFMGSGSAGVAAIRLGRKFIGIDHSEKYVAMARTRIAAAIPRAPVDVAPKTYPVSGSRLILGDCLEVLPTIPDGSVDAVIADLPYGMSKLEWDKPIPLDVLWREFRRILRPTGAVVLTASQPFTAELIVSNREWFKYSLVWEKSRPTGFLQANQMPLRAHEDICVFSPGVLIGRHRSRRQMTYNAQGITAVAEDGNARRQRGASKFLGGTVRNERRPTHTGYPTSIIRFPSEPRPEHPTQKPLALMQHLVRTYTHAGDTIVDCCMGSGSTGVAAIREGRAFIGIEQNPQYFEIARRRFATEGLETVIEAGGNPDGQAT